MGKKGFFAVFTAALLALSAVSCNKGLHVDEDDDSSTAQESSAAEGEKGTASTDTNKSVDDINSYLKVKDLTPAMWKVTDPSTGNSLYMFGIVRFMTETSTPLPDYVMEAYDNSDSLAVEFDMSGMAQDMQQMQEFYSHMVYTDGTDIKDHISEETYQKARDYLSGNFFYNNMMDGYSAGFWASQVNAVAVGQVRNLIMETIDTRFVTKAKEDGKDVISLYDADAQLKAIDACSDELADFMISDTIRRAGDIKGFVSNLATQVDYWAKGDVEPLAEELYWGDRSADLDDDYEVYLQANLYDYNDIIAEKTEEFLKEGKTPFFVIGVTHFSGKKGVDDILRDKGYTVEVLPQ